MRSELLTAVNTERGPSGLWHRPVVWCGKSVEPMYMIFGTLKTEVAGSSETLVTIYCTIWQCYIPEDRT
jgi:hypothetical protein